MNKVFCLPTTGPNKKTKALIKKLRKVDFEKDQIFIALFLENKSEVSKKKKNDENSDLVYIPFYTPFADEKTY